MEFYHGVLYGRLYILAEAARAGRTTHAIVVEKENILLAVLCRRAYLFVTVNNNGCYRLVWKGDLDD